MSLFRIGSDAFAPLDGLVTGLARFADLLFAMSKRSFCRNACRVRALRGRLSDSGLPGSSSIGHSSHLAYYHPLAEVRMSRLIVSAALLFLPVLVMAHSSTPPAQGEPAAKPQAPKTSSDDVMALLEKGEVFFLDVREPKELVDLGTLEGYVNIPLGQIEIRLGEIPKDKAIITA
jgi:hypothetical protein